jgi:membrane protease YdiL (CAAX protease family)
MKWLTAVLPYLAVAIGLFWVRHAFLTLLGFHLAIILSLVVARSPVPLSLLFRSRNARWVILSVLLCGSSGISLYFLLSYFGVVGDLHEHIESLRLTSSTWPLFITYFALANPLIEEYFWRGYLGSPTKGFYPSDFLYSGFHGLILWGKVQPGLIVYSLILLVAAGWFWRQLARIDGGLLAPVMGHMAADLTILLAVYQMSI